MFFVLVLLGSVGLSGCGRRGPLELPPGAPGQSAAENVNTQADRQAATFNQSAPPGVIQPPNQVVQVDRTSAQLAAHPPERAINEPRPAKANTFLLDPLL